MLTKSDKEFQSIIETNGVIARRVTPIGSGSFVEGLVFDYIEATYPTTSSEVYTYKNGGSGGTTVATITITYTDSTKGTLSSVEKS